MLFLFVVALGTDYNILISDRLREEMAKPCPARVAVREALRHTAPAIATAGLVLAGSFASLAVNPDTAMQEVGFSTGLGIVLSSLVLYPDPRPRTGSGTGPRDVVAAQGPDRRGKAGRAGVPLAGDDIDALSVRQTLFRSSG
ncbi:MMPL family transporter [Yinghuangia aomiensis]